MLSYYCSKLTGKTGGLVGLLTTIYLGACKSGQQPAKNPVTLHQHHN
jgi:hypothetical protein